MGGPAIDWRTNFGGTAETELIRRGSSSSSMKHLSGPDGTGWFGVFSCRGEVLEAGDEDEREGESTFHCV